MTESRSPTEQAVVTLLFTDLVGSTELLSRTGDEQAQRIFRAHHDLLSEAAAAHGGQEVKWLGDGLMVAFASAAGALRAAIAMQQSSRRPVEGERLSIRVGLNAGETLRDAADYFGTAVVVARRLCDSAEGGQILCAETVAGLLAGKTGFVFTELGPVVLRGVPKPVRAYELRYEAEAAAERLATQISLVGRDAELARLTARLEEAAAGGGGLAMVLGGPGIGKTRLLDELAERAWREGAFVLRGGCFEAEWSPPYAPFAEALEAHVASARPEELRTDLGEGAASLAQIVPAIRGVLTDVPEPVPLQPDEERFRLLDATASFLLARSRRAPVLVCLDDLQWADRGTVAMLRHTARLTPRGRVLIVGAYRDGEVEKTDALVEALGSLRREVEYDRVKLEGLAAQGVAQLLSALGGGQDVEERVGAAWVRETEGNPLFVRELLTHLVEEGHVYRGQDGRWITDRPLQELGVPEEVREVMGRRLARLSERAHKFLSAACAFEGSFDFDVVTEVAEIQEDHALDAVDEALAAQVLQPAGGSETYAFTNGLLRQSLYADLSPTRKARLHRKVAEALEVAYGEHPNPGFWVMTATRSPLQAAEIASQYHRSRGRPGAERGLDPALTAAAHAEATGAHEEAARFLRMALELLPKGDPRRLRLLGRLGMALTWALHFDEAVKTAADAAEALAAAEGPDAAAGYLSEAAYACYSAGSIPHAWMLAPKGLGYAGTRRDVAWARLVLIDHERQEADDPETPGIPIDSPERAEAARLLQVARLDPMGPGPMEAYFASREEAAASSNLAILLYMAGEYARTLPLVEAEAEAASSRGQVARAACCEAFASMALTALGRLPEAREALERAAAPQVGLPPFIVVIAKDQLADALDEGWEELAGTFGQMSSALPKSSSWARGSIYGRAARANARLGKAEESLQFLGLLAPWLERGPAWMMGFPFLASNATETLWFLERTEHADVIEAALREKVLGPDFRGATVDGRLALARICALTGRHDEAQKWFTEARDVLTEEGAHPLLSIADYDEALMHVRRGDPGDAEAARPFLERARAQFEELGMTGWIRRAEELSQRLG